MTGLSAFIVACGIVRQVTLLEAIVRVESGGNPIALAVNGAVELVRTPRDPDDAAAMARWLAAHGYNFDAGLAQVNSANFARLGLDSYSVFEPCANLRAASRVLEECRRRALRHGHEGEHAIAAALSCYNTGHLTRGLKNGYVTAVRAAAAGSTRSQPVATDRADMKPATRLDTQGTASPRSGAVDRGRRSADAHPRDEVFATVLADAFDATCSGEEPPR